MTREKKELLKQLQAIDEKQYICTAANEQMGEMTAEGYEAIQDYYDKLRSDCYERLNVLMHGRVNDFFREYVI